MTDPTGSVVVGAAQAIVKPVEKLIDVVSAGIGRAYEPVHVRRLARAEADRMAIIATAEATVSDIQRRAAQRWLAVEERRQQNMEAIADAAMLELPQAVTAEPVQPDWAARFFDECKDVSDEGARRLWARLLAGEVAQPGCFSLRTLRVLSGLSKEEANSFNSLCAMFVDGVGGGTFFSVRGREDFMRTLGLPFHVRTGLEAAGLIQQHPQGLSAPVRGPITLFPAGRARAIWALHSSPETKLPVGVIALTPAGRELVRLCEDNENAEHVAFVVSHLRANGFRVEEVPVQHHNNGVTSVMTPEWALEYWKEHRDDLKPAGFDGSRSSGAQ